MKLNKLIAIASILLGINVETSVRARTEPVELCFIDVAGHGKSADGRVLDIFWTGDRYQCALYWAEISDGPSISFSHGMRDGGGGGGGGAKPKSAIKSTPNKPATSKNDPKKAINDFVDKFKKLDIKNIKLSDGRLVYTRDITTTQGNCAFSLSSSSNGFNDLSLRFSASFDFNKNTIDVHTPFITDKNSGIEITVETNIQYTFTRNDKGGIKDPTKMSVQTANIRFELESGQSRYGIVPSDPLRTTIFNNIIPIIEKAVKQCSELPETVNK